MVNGNWAVGPEAVTGGQAAQAGVEITVDTSTCCGSGAAAAEFVARMMAAPPPEAAEGGGQRLRTCSRAKKKAEPGNRIYLG